MEMVNLLNAFSRPFHPRFIKVSCGFGKWVAMKALRLFLLLAACLVTAWVFLNIRCIRLDEKGKPVLLNNEEVECAVPDVGAVSPRLA